MAGMGEPAARVGGGDLVEERPQRGLQHVTRAGSRAAQERLRLAPRLLDGVEVRRAGRQEEEPTAGAFDQRLHRAALVCAQVVEHHHLPGPQRRHEQLAHVGGEHLRIGRRTDGAHELPVEARRDAADVRFRLGAPLLALLLEPEVDDPFTDGEARGDLRARPLDQRAGVQHAAAQVGRVGSRHMRSLRQQGRCPHGAPCKASQQPL
jgi:hypothetical protein